MTATAKTGAKTKGAPKGGVPAEVQTIVDALEAALTRKGVPLPMPAPECEIDDIVEEV